jgi:dsRNA-specific ribonuclease
VTVGTNRYPSAWGPSKKEAEQKAAHRALVTIGAIQDNHQNEYQD